MHKQLVQRASLAVAFGVIALLVVAAGAQAAAVQPVLVNDNPQCSDLGLTSIHKFEPVKDASAAGITIDVTGDTFSWTSSVAVDTVIVKGGPDANVYSYPFDTFSDSGLQAPDNGGKPYGLSHIEFCTDKQNEPKPNPAIVLEKTGNATAAAGSTFTYSFKATNTGNVTLVDVVLTDTKCQSAITRTGANAGDTTFNAGDVWFFTCTMVAPQGPAQVENLAEVCGDYVPGQGQPTEVCDEDTHTYTVPPPPVPPVPSISLDKTGAATAAAGSTFTYSFKATNTGNVTLATVVLTDAKCASAITRVEPNLADPTFDAGDSWYFTCTVTAPAGPAQVDNTAEVCADYVPGQGEPMKVCDEDTHTFTVPPPTVPPVTPNVVPPTTTPDGGVLPETVVSGRARLRGPSGCVKQAFRARVSGRSIASVTFFVDGRKVKTVRRGSAFSVKVNPAKYGLGRHKIVALVRFTAESGTKARRLPLTFRRCAQGAVAPRFTG